MITFRKFYTDDDSKSTEGHGTEFILPGNLEPGNSALLGYVVYPVLYCQLRRGRVFEFYCYK